MNLIKYYEIFIKRLWLLLILTAVSAILTYYIDQFKIEPIYESRVTLYILSKDSEADKIDINDIRVSQVMVKDYRVIIRSRHVLNEVISRLDIKDLLYEDLSDNITVGLMGNTLMLEIKVQDIDPARSADLANTISEVFIENIVNFTNFENINIIDKAFIPETHIKPNLTLDLVISVVISLLVYSIITFLIEFSMTSVTVDTILNKKIDITLIGTIPNFNIK